MGVREMVQPMFHMIWTTAMENVELMPDPGIGFKPEGLETRARICRGREDSDE